MFVQVQAHGSACVITHAPHTTSERERAREAAFWRDRAAQGEEQALFPEPPKDRPETGPTTSSAFAATTAKWLPAEGGGAASRQQRQQQQQQEQRKGGSPPSLAVGDDGEEEATGAATTPLHADIFVHCTPQPPEEEEEEEDGAQEGRRRRRLPALPLPYLRLQRRTQVGQLREVLMGALGLDEEEEGPERIEILCQGELLTAQHSLHFVERTRWRDQKLAPPLRLHYRRRRR